MSLICPGLVEGDLKRSLALHSLLGMGHLAFNVYAFWVPFIVTCQVVGARNRRIEEFFPLLESERESYEMAQMILAATVALTLMQFLLQLGLQYAICKLGQPGPKDKARKREEPDGMELH